MNIAFVSQPWEGALPPSSSIPIWTYQVARRLARSHDVLVYARRNKDQDRVMLDAGVRYMLTRRTIDDYMLRVLNPLAKYFPARHPLYTSSLYYLPYMIAVARDLRRQQRDIVHTFNFPQLAPIIRAFNPAVKIVLHMHCDWLPGLHRATTEKRLARVDQVLGTTEYITRRIREAYPRFAHRCHTVFNAVDTEEFAGRTSAQLAAPDRPKKLLFVGRVSPEKGVHVLIDAFSQVAQQDSEVVLDIIGPHWVASLEFIASLGDDDQIRALKPFYNGQEYLAQLQERLPPASKDRVRFVGPLPNSELPACYRQADLFLFPSVVNEAFGIPIIEALASETPVIASRAGGMVELIDHGKTGLLVPPGDAAALAAAIRSLLHNDALRASMGQLGRQRVIESFSWESTAQSLLSHYQRIGHDPASSDLHTHVTRAGPHEV